MAFLHYICFSLSWLALVQYESTYMLGVIAYFVFFIGLSQQRTQTILFMLYITIGGLTIDTLFIQFGVLEFINNNPWPPLWYILLWPLFATAEHSTLIALNRAHIFIQIITGAVASYLAFIFGSQVNTSITIAHIWIIVICWSIIFPLSLRLHQKIVQPPKLAN